MFRNRRQPDAPPEPQHFDLPALAAERRRREAEATAAAMSKVPPAVHQIVAGSRTPQPDPLVRLLDRPLLLGLPPLELVEEHDPGLAALQSKAFELDRAARRRADEYAEHQPGGAAFRQELEACTTPASIEWLLTTGGPRRFAHAWTAWQAATRADGEFRTAAAGADDLRRRLTDEATERAEEIQALLERTISTKRRRHLEDAEELCSSWRTLLALREWTLAPRYPYRPMDERVIPKTCREAHADALMALGIEVVTLSEGQMVDGIVTDGAWPVGTAP